MSLSWKVLQRAAPIALLLLVSASCSDPGADSDRALTTPITPVSAASTLDASGVLGCEDTTSWQVEDAQLSLTSVDKTQGAAALQLSTPAVARLTSEPFSAAGLGVGPYFSLDLRIPGPQADPDWNGSVDVQISIPSMGVTNVALSSYPLMGRSAGAFHTLVWKLPYAVREALETQPTDVTLKLDFVLPLHTGPYIIDNLRFDAEPTEEDHLSVFGFESASQFTASVPIFTSTQTAGEGVASLGINAQGYSVINARPVFSGGLTVSDQLTVQFYLPVEQANPWWYGDLEIRVVCPSAGLATERSLGNVALTGLATGASHALSFSVPADVKQALAARRTDLQFRFLLNVPNESTGTYLLDDLRFAPLVIAPVRSNSMALDTTSLLTDAHIAAATGGQLSFTLFPDLTLTLQQVRVETVSNGENIIGQLALPHAGSGYLSIVNGRVAGVFRGLVYHYNLHSVAPGQVTVQELTESDYPREAAPRMAVSAATLSSSGGMRPQAPRRAPLTVNPNPVLDIMVLYTQDVDASFIDTAAVEARINTAITMANGAYGNSGIFQRLNLVHTARVQLTESTDSGENLSKLQDTSDGEIDEIHALRDRFGADLVVLLLKSMTNCGQANLAVYSEDADDDSAFAVVKERCIDLHSFSHEVGHLSGARHDWEADWIPWPPLYAHGLITVPGQWRTIMAYEDRCKQETPQLKCPRIDFFSTPLKTNPPDGRPVGKASSADNARRINETAATLENYRIRGPRVSLYEGSGGTQDHVCVVSTATDDALDFSAADPRFCDTDEAKSIRIFDTPAGRVLRFFDSPDGSRQDDWVEIRVKRAISEKLIGTFESSFEDDDVRVVYHRNNGLDGKVSRAEIASEASGPLVDLYESADGLQNLLCSVTASQPSSIDFSGPGDCDEDEAESVKLYDMPAGRVVRLFDSPGGSRQDDWVEIRVKRAFGEKLIGTLEGSFEDDDVRVVFHRNNELNGQVSRLEVALEPSGPIVDLHAGNTGTQGLVCSVGVGSPVSLDFTASGDCDNDVARSLTAFDLPQGALLFLYDSPSGNRQDDWTVIEALAPLKSRTIDSFQSTFEDPEVRVLHFPNNGLDGQISRLEVTTASTLQGVLSFYEGHDGTQNKVCDLSADTQLVRFQSHPSCDNDEARSIVLSMVEAGTTIEVYNDPDCRDTDDWARYTIKRTVFRATIPHFEEPVDTDDILAELHIDDQLNGKVSCVSITRP
ncbi:reprolysin-like metallopeptidase [Hyalangium sp.]|uniref:reprolysin-like metallopeptidase n=1 Tax=Hyalangium sp. TaxID=2028555 RepID=UPI002D5D5191|nr:M12 family metallo-peptidase [Hyalangium sp.]HYH95032.1 M12 family metallo-peptidase [Hyalangium sp.]